MSQYHLTVKLHGRQGGKRAETRAAKGRPRKGPESSVAAASYRSGNTLLDERTGTTHRYSRADRVKHTEILAPADAPQWATDRAQLWNAVERREKRKDAQLFREFEIGLPVELNLDQQVELLRGWIAQEITPQGAVADVAVHLGRDGNPHAHVMVTLRGVSAEGWGGQKLREWEDRSALEKWRSSWAEHANRALARAGRDERIDHRSYAEQDADLPADLRREPMRKVGPGGQGKSRDQENARIRERNAARVEAAAIYRAERDRAAETVRGITHHELTPVQAPQAPEPVQPAPAPVQVAPAPVVAPERTPERPPTPAPRSKTAKKPQKQPIFDKILDKIGGFALDPFGIKRRREEARKEEEARAKRVAAQRRAIVQSWRKTLEADPSLIRAHVTDRDLWEGPERLKHIVDLKRAGLELPPQTLQRAVMELVVRISEAEDKRRRWEGVRAAREKEQQQRQAEAARPRPARPVIEPGDDWPPQRPSGWERS